MNEKEKERIKKMTTPELRNALQDLGDQWVSMLAEHEGMRYLAEVFSPDQRLALLEAVWRSGTETRKGDAVDYVRLANASRGSLFQALTEDLGNWHPDGWTEAAAYSRWMGEELNEGQADSEEEEEDRRMSFRNEEFAIGFIRGAVESMEKVVGEA